MKIRELYSDESKWHQGHYAVTATGRQCNEDNPEAVAFCLYGAVAKCYAYTEGSVIWARINAALPMRALSWNDTPGRTFAEVKALVERLDI